MNVTVENLAPCKKLLRIEVEPAKVDEKFDSVTKEFQRQAAFPGFRPGKAPREMVMRKYGKEIADEVKNQLLKDSYSKAVEEQKIDVLGRPDIEEIQFDRGQPFQFAATVETAPDFELPEYKGIPVKRDPRAVTDEDVEKAVDALRHSQASFNTVERAAQTGDMAVVSYTGSVEGKPIIELAPAAMGLNEQKNFWIEIGGTAFIPGFADQLLGAKAGEKRSVKIEFPANFGTPELAGKSAVYEVEIAEVKERVLPAVDDAFAKSYGAENLEKLRAGVRRDLENELEHKRNRDMRNQVVRSLLNRVNFELPETAVAQETRNVVYDLVQENAKRGVSRDTIEREKEQIYSAAAQGAKERVKVGFLLQRIAEKEDIKVAQEEVAQRIQGMAQMYQIPFEKFLKDLQQRNGIIQVFDQIMNEKAIEFLLKNAQIQDAAPGAEANPS